MKDASHLYEVERRARHAERPGVQDTFYVLEGELRLFLRDPKEEIGLTNPGQRSATFLALQGIGEYDYVPLTAKG